MKWICVLIWLCILHTADACFDDGEFYCARLWYFWFVIFFIFIFMLVMAIVITNLCTKKKRRVGARGKQRRRKKQAKARQRGSKASILSKATINTDTTSSFPQPPNKFPGKPQSKDQDAVNNRTLFTKSPSNKGDHNKTSLASNSNSSISTIENGLLKSISDGEMSPVKDVVLTTRDLPTALVMEEDETDHGKQSAEGNVKDTTC